MNKELTWLIYNIIREIECAFRTLKTDLDLRPIFHKKDGSTMAHLHLGLLAYWVVNTVRYQLKKTENDSHINQETSITETNNDTGTDSMPVNFQWKEIIRIMNTQKSVFLRKWLFSYSLFEIIFYNVRIIFFFHLIQFFCVFFI